MKNFTQLEEGLLAGQDATLKTGDKISKKMAEVEAIKKNLIYLDVIWNNTYSGSKYTQDAIGTDINIGDVVLFNSEEDVTDGYWSFGIVVEEPDKYGENCMIIAASARVGKATLEDPYADCVRYYATTKNIIVLAKKKNATRILQMLEKTVGS
jgi:hypothetical protein